MPRQPWTPFESLCACVPPDDARRAPLIQRLIDAASIHRPVPSRYAVVDDTALASLLPIAEHVRAIKFTMTKYRWQLQQRPLSPTTWPLVQPFDQLIKLKIRSSGIYRMDDVHLAILSQCLPQLQKLVIRGSPHIVNSLRLLYQS